MKPLPLRDAHDQLGARWAGWQGWEIVRTHGDTEREHRALTTHVAVADLSPLGAIRFVGRDAADYLHRQLTNSVRGLRVGEGCHACYLTANGQMVGEMSLHRTGECEFLALTMPACATPLGEALERLIFREDCRVEPTPPGDVCLLLAGPHSSAVLRESLGIAAEAISEWGCTVARRGGSDLIVTRSFPLSVPAHVILAPALVAKEVLGDLLFGGAEPCGLDVLNALRIESGLPLFGEDHDQSWNPLDAGLEGAVDFRKGCFPGQEAVGKIHNLSHPRRVLRGFVCEGEMPPQERAEVIAEGKPIGAITSVCLSLSLDRPLALGHLKWGARGISSPVLLGENGIVAHVVDLPIRAGDL